MAEEEERIITVPLRVVRTVPRTKRAPRAIKAIREHVVRHLKAKTEDVWIDPQINEILWARGIEQPPKRIRVKVIKFEDELVEVSLPEE
jgi:large subunit ribosomal protein L31e